MVLDSLTAQLSRGSIALAESTMSDLGHYIADAHQPLHCTNNYDGAMTGNNGIHSRYETSMINSYQGLITIQKDSVQYIHSPLDFAFEFIYRSNSFVDSILSADTYAKSTSGWSGSGNPPSTYYSALWERTQSLTIQEFQHATIALASFWFTAWTNALPATLVRGEEAQLANELVLMQNYPNPFNASTIISYRLAVNTPITLKVYDVRSREVALLINGYQRAGNYKFNFDGTKLPSGIYLVRLNGLSFSKSIRILLLK